MHQCELMTFFILFSISNGYAPVEKYLKICNRNADEVNNCVEQAVRDGLALMCDGIEELALPRLDPYSQEEIRVEYNNNQIVARMVMNDVYVYGLRESKVHAARLRADEDHFHLEADLTTPHVFVKGNYYGSGAFNALKVEARGTFNTSMKHLVYTWKLDGAPEVKNNETFIKITSFYMRPDVDNMLSYLTSDIPNSKDIIDFVNKYTNDNWRFLYRELAPYAQANWNKIGIQVSNKIFRKVPYDILFPK